MSEDNVHNINRLSEAKVLLPQVELILRIIELTMSAFEQAPFAKSYLSVKRLMVPLENEKRLLIVHRDRLRKVLEKKGKL